MVALQKDVFSFASPAVKQKPDNITRGRSTINVVTYEHYRVATAGSDCVEHGGKFVNTAVNIADREETSAGCARNLFLGGARPDREIFSRQRLYSCSTRLCTSDNKSEIMPRSSILRLTAL